MLSEELLKQAAEELALALIEGLPEPEQCQHQFSKELERKMQLLFPLLHPVHGEKRLIQKQSIPKLMTCNEGWPAWSAFSLWIHSS